jgi:hypothetical protein
MRERIAELQTEFEARAQPVFEAPAVAADRPARRPYWLDATMIAAHPFLDANLATCRARRPRRFGSGSTFSDVHYRSAFAPASRLHTRSWHLAD